jgi:hypothetical protein
LRVGVLKGSDAGKDPAMGNKIDRRSDVNPKEGLPKYGTRESADPVNHKYPIDTKEHVRAAWRYINKESNADEYDPDEVKTIKNRIKKAAENKGIDIDADD